MRLRLLLALLPLTLLAACDSAEPEPTASDLLTADAWVPRSADSVPVGSSVTRYEFDDDGTLVLTFEDGSTEEETWSLEEDDAFLLVADGTSSRYFRILRLTADELALEERPAVSSDEPDFYELIHP